MNLGFKIFYHFLLDKKGKNLFYLTLSVIPNVLAALLEGLSFGLILFAFQMLTGEGRYDSLGTWGKFLVRSWFDGRSNYQMFVFFILLAIASQILRSVFIYLGQISTVSFALKIQKKLQMDVYVQILRFSFPFVSKYRVGDLLEYVKIPSRLINDLIDPLNRTIVSGLATLALTGVMFYISPPSTLLAVVIFGALFFQKLIIKKICSISENLTQETVEFSKHTTQTLHGLRIIHTFAKQSYVLEKILATLEKIASNSRQINVWAQAINPINETVGIILVGVFLLLGQMLIPGDAKEVTSMLLAFIVIIYRLNGRIQTFISSLGIMALHWGSVVRLETILDKKDKAFDDSQISIPIFKKEIRFSHVSFMYPDTFTPALEELNFTLSKGKTIAFVGASGAGKSSIIDLILGLYKPSQGRIAIDGVDLQQLNMELWRNLLGVVSQDIFIFPETVEENIRFGKANASFDELVLAAKISGAHEFIMRLPNQYQSLLGERGYRLSGGEKQKLALARALVRDPEILILDEASSSLDSHSELLIQNALMAFKEKKTMILVAHRLSTIKNADMIFVIEKGKMIESGSHDQLIELQGQYASFWKAQSIDWEGVLH